ncbi:hypothetical protein BDE36_1163 [Arcticibacter tournemirensis]|nr:hypothetical protein BDE36_1163 [Arcticibacter tournemirensis]
MLSLFSHRTKKCPRCSSTDLSRIRRSVIDKLFSFGGDVRKYRCDKCFHTFFVHIKAQTEKQKQQSV